METTKLDSIQDNECEKCYEPYIFCLKEQEQEFHIGLQTILECLRFAEIQGAVPPLQNDWWGQIMNRYDINFS